MEWWHCLCSNTCQPSLERSIVPIPCLEWGKLRGMEWCHEWPGNRTQHKTEALVTGYQLQQANMWGQRLWQPHSDNPSKKWRWKYHYLGWPENHIRTSRKRTSINGILIFPIVLRYIVLLIHTHQLWFVKRRSLKNSHQRWFWAKLQSLRWWRVFSFRGVSDRSLQTAQRPPNHTSLQSHHCDSHTSRCQGYSVVSRSLPGGSHRPRTPPPPDSSTRAGWDEHNITHTHAHTHTQTDTHTHTQSYMYVHTHTHTHTHRHTHTHTHTQTHIHTHIYTCPIIILLHMYREIHTCTCIYMYIHVRTKYMCIYVIRGI